MLYALLLVLQTHAAAQAHSPVAALTRHLAQDPDAAVADVADRFYSFLWSTAKDSLYVPVKRRKKDPALSRSLKAAVAAWVKDHAKTGEAAEVFYVLGAGEKSPAWARGDADLDKALSGYRTRDFVKKMAPWTEDSSGLPGQWSKKHAAEWAQAFLNDAASQARRFLDHRPVQEDQAYEREGKSLSGRREPPRGEVEVLRFKKATDLVPPPVPKMIEKVGESVPVPGAKQVIEGVGKGLDAVPTPPLHPDDSTQNQK